MSDESSACWIPLRHNTLSDGDVKVCRMTVPDGESGQADRTQNIIREQLAFCTEKKIHARPTRRGHLYIRFRGKHLCVAYNDASMCMTLYPWCRLSPKTLQLHMRRRSFVSQSGWSCVSDEELYGFTDNVNASIWCRSWEFAVASGGGCSSVRKHV